MLFYTTPVPRSVFELMPSLKDAEVRVLFVIVRQTLGYRDVTGKTKTGKKERDWISSSQFVRFTGLSNRAISIASATLAAKGHIIITDQANAVLATPGERKGRSRLYYRLGDHLMPATVDYAEHVKSKISALTKILRCT